MSMVDTVRAAMMQAMKNKEKDRKEALSAMLTVLKNAEIDKREPLTDEESFAVLKKELKQLKETYDTCPPDRTEILEATKIRMDIFKEFVPADMGEDEIRKVIEQVLAELSIEKPTAKEKGLIMKNLMPLVKGKADGKLVNEVLQGMMQ